ncbi:HesA/MoeB/ThiF family protein [Nitratifractor salsuginis]|uniref:UBA/THIF-type NAD/FAD binding protein n=1 Tax=Nitratifractor salsuginis (strain DSM 16511 / JCM 12458 / E9I37-1) TaxID=749222 RepID=E6X0B2_NITSE|nr:ThiF family adenylyltransferase [Nitratifractor salsuginis]ADV45701.1 UBA/THIF-type NAD/FAD binding protein [Nitratifractor salsuginis DSM 16511]
MRSEEYFHRQIQLWGEEAQERLAAKRIVIIGCGGLGSTLALALGCSGIGEIHLVDFDEVSLHNIHRQIVFTLEDQGGNKAEVSAELLRKKNPFVKVQAHPCDFDSFAKSNTLAFDLILDATDNLPVRSKIDAWAKSCRIPWVYASVEAFNGQVCFFDRADFGVFAVSDHTPAGIAAPIVMQVGSFQANLALRYLAGLPIRKDQLHYLYYDEEGELVLKKFKLPVVSEE